MKKFLFFFGLLTLTVNLCSAAERFCVVRTTDLAGKEHYEVMTYDDFKKHSKAISKERLQFSKALTLTQKEWKKEDMGAGKSFPRGCVKPRTTKVMGIQYKTEERAQAKLDYYLEKPERDVEREKKRKETMQKMNQGGGSHGGAESQEAKKRKEEKKKASEEKREPFHAKAREYFAEKLQTIKDGATESAEPEEQQ